MVLRAGAALILSTGPALPRPDDPTTPSSESGRPWEALQFRAVVVLTHGLVANSSLGQPPSPSRPLAVRAVADTCDPPSRESKELADLARLHPTSCAPNGLNPNLMVTGGPALAGSGRWSADPAAHLATHPWLPRSGSTSMWLAGHPYGECGVQGLSPSLREGWEGAGAGQELRADSCLPFPGGPGPGLHFCPKKE